ncbi:retinol dehydrogenase 12 [Hypoxylon rubiginosum]|uniref:Retinol dehydrogenase 12 n=1 Tax=Hypoxylon rubiginosum TaxID=110542 RepID=A0ACC0CYR5_9PEZI|nr:retinol dehydrogenase 12 [Hypoxylon rubiginosum]
MGQAYSQVFPPPAKLTGENLPDQSGKVFIVTGATSGLGKELANQLYAKNAKVYVAARSSAKATSTINGIVAANPHSSGTLVYLHLDLDDLSGIKKSADEFLSKEQRLDVLWNNAGLMIPPKGTTTKQGYEKQLGTNALAPFLFTKLLTPILLSTARVAPPGSVRVIWLSSVMAENLAPNGGVDMNNLDYKMEKYAMQKYAVSKAANTLYSAEFARRYGDNGLISVSLDPGNLKTDLQRVASPGLRRVWNLLLHDAIHGAYTELFAGLSPDIAIDKNNAWIIPYGRFGHLRKDIEAACKLEQNGGTGNAQKFWEWSENEVQPFT